ncbi:PREDICTED: ester hydrolase C11orf54 homolog [Wasmannia auropunctata]|uniref:ester hydrolase C11orf54 homolog n=1 Tax=Wasmannia auropunctata TaxID=64793 RepID=UPI0005ED4E33|nr:PREDICTED: ester hydrolase C11orf54 homolog [Wasmannia auropunctata]
MDSKFPADQIHLFIPEGAKLAAVLQNELSTDFEEVTVEWVDCPDLTEEPFNLATPGLCGDTAIFDVGGVSNLFPFPQENKIYFFKDMVRTFNRLRRVRSTLPNDTLIIGGGLTKVSEEKLLGELIINASFDERTAVIKNKSRFAFLKTLEQSKNQKCKLIPLIDNTNPKCHMYGNFFFNNGLREQVLKIQAKNRVSRDFTVALQRAISRFASDGDLMGLGGTFVVKNGKTKHHIIQNDWKGPIRKSTEIRKCVQFCEMPTPVVAFATFLSADRYYYSKFPPKINFLTRWHAHSYSAFGGGHYHETKQNSEDNNVEYLGYFSIATKLYRIDPVPMFNEMPNFSYL